MSEPIPNNNLLYRSVDMVMWRIFRPINESCYWALDAEKKLWNHEHMIWNLLAKKVYFDDRNRIYKKVAISNNLLTINIQL